MDTKTKQVAEAVMDCLMQDTRSAVGDFVDSADQTAEVQGDVAKFVMYKWDESPGHGPRSEYVPPRGQFVYTVTIEGKYVPYSDE